MEIYTGTKEDMFPQWVLMLLKKKKEKENTFDNIQHKSYFSFSIQSLSHTHSHVKLSSVKQCSLAPLLFITYWKQKSMQGGKRKIRS